MSDEDRISSFPHTSRVASVSMILGVLSMLSIFLVLWGAISVMKAGIFTFLPVGYEYVYPLFWLLWLILPICAVICSSYAKKTANDQRGQRLAFLGLVLGYVSLICIAAIVFGEVILFLRTIVSGCTPNSPCS